MTKRVITDYAFMAKRIRSAVTLEQTNRYEKSIDRLFLAGIFTTNQLSRLDSIIVDRRIAINNTLSGRARVACSNRRKAR